MKCCVALPTRVAPSISVFSKEDGRVAQAKSTGGDADAELLMQQVPPEDTGPGPPLPLYGCPGETPGNSQKRSSLQDHPLEMRLKGWAQQFPFFSPPSSFSLFYLLLSFFPHQLQHINTLSLKHTLSWPLLPPISFPFLHSLLLPHSLKRLSELSAFNLNLSDLSLWFYLFIFFAVVGLCCCARASSSCSEQRLLSSCNV